MPCPSGSPVITCAAAITDQVQTTNTNDFPGADYSLFLSPPYDRIHVPASGVLDAVPAGGRDEEWQFTCGKTGTVSATLTAMDCDLDLIVYDTTGNVCNPQGNVPDASGNSGTASEQVQFDCLSVGQKFDLVVERFSCTSTQGKYTLDLIDDNPLYTGCYTQPCVPEVCDGLDNDCDGTPDDGLPVTNYYADLDKDSYGDPTNKLSDCKGVTPTGYVLVAGDCRDNDSAVNPGKTEVCNLVDDDCDTQIDEGLPTSTWYPDGDKDGYGLTSGVTNKCAAPAGHVAQGGDCNDADAGRYPGKTEVPYDGVDQDCSGADLTDRDGDGHAWAGAGGDDCSDNDAAIVPGALEAANGADDNCNGKVDEGTVNADDDGDGFSEAGGDCDDTAQTVSPAAREGAACDAIDTDCDGTKDDGTTCVDDDGDGFAEDEGDCDDGLSTVSPTTAEIAANGIDDDCDGTVDQGVTDADSDGFSAAGGDCSDSEASRYPGAPELDNGVDDDCDTVIDEGTNAADDDGDGITEDAGDCDDTDAAAHPGADETANGRDDDCDGTADDGTDRYDDDGDGLTEDGGDCDDDDVAVTPASDEVANGVDDDCDGLVDEGVDDADGDGVTAADGDCDDQDGWRNPGVSEMCDEVDNDCNGDIDEGCEDTGTVVYEDPKCGCASGSASGSLGLVFVALFALRRRARAQTSS